MYNTYSLESSWRLGGRQGDWAIVVVQALGRAFLAESAFFYYWELGWSCLRLRLRLPSDEKAEILVSGLGRNLVFRDTLDWVGTCSYTGCAAGLENGAGLAAPRA